MHILFAWNLSQALTRKQQQKKNTHTQATKFCEWARVANMKNMMTDSQKKTSATMCQRENSDDFVIKQNI